MESILIWTIASLVVGAVALPYLVRFRGRAKHDAERKAEAARLGIDKPTAQFPFIDATRCIGCGTCVDACPEKDVLGIVGGTATVVNGLKCVGHGECERACPVGAIEIGLGDVKSRVDIPVMNDWHESTVPGLFIAGELGGLALVRNAVAQGKKVIERITQAKSASRHGARGAGDVLDVVIVGAGPAGLATAAAAKEKGLTHVVLEKESDLGGTIFHYPRRKLVLVQPLDLPLWGRLERDEYTKEEVLEVFQDLVRRHRLSVRFGQAVSAITKEEGVFHVRAGDVAYRSHYVVLALGRRGSPRKLGAQGEDLPKVMYQLMDAESYKGHRILIVGGGDSAVEAAQGLARQEGNRVTLSYRREKLLRIKRKNEERTQELIATGRIQALFNSEVKEILPQTVRLSVGARTVEIENDYLFVFAGGEPPFQFLRQIGVRFGGEALSRVG